MTHQPKQNDTMGSEVMGTEAKEKSGDHWEGDTFILAGEKFITGKTLSTLMVCDISHDRAQTLPDGSEGVTKIADKVILPVADIQEQNNGIMLHHRGRPKKVEGEPVSRMTTWRRNKAGQGILL